MFRGKRIISLWLLSVMALVLAVAPQPAAAAAAFTWNDYRTVTIGDTGSYEPGFDFTSGRAGAYSVYNDLEVEQNKPNISVTSPAGAFMDLGEVDIDAVSPMDGTWVKKAPAVAGHVYLYKRNLTVVKFQVVRVVAGQLQYSLPAVTITYAGGQLTGSEKLPDVKSVKLAPSCSSKTGSDAPSCVKISTKDNKVTLAWKAPKQAPEDGYEIYRSLTGEDNSWTLMTDFPVTGTNWVDNTALPGATYYYAVVAIDGNESQVVKVTVPVSYLPEDADVLTVRFEPGSRIAWVGDQRFVLDVAPQFTATGYLMLPARFLARALGGVVAFNSANGKFAIGLGDTIYVFQLGKDTALVGEETIQLNVAPVIVDDRALIPADFVYDYMGLDMSFDTDTSVLTITRDLSKEAEPTPAPSPEPQPEAAKPSRASYSFVPGKYALSTGGPSNINTGSWLQLNADGTYVWNSKWDGKLIRGTWEPFNSASIILYDGQEGRDWLVDRTVESQQTDADINVYNEYTQYLGTKM